jgi:predicted nucleic acid-binding protein
MNGTRHKRLRVFLDSNVIISAFHSQTSISRSCVMSVLAHHQLVLCSYSIEEIHRVIQKKFSHRVPDWHAMLAHLRYELIITPTDPPLFLRPVPPIRDPNDIPILISVFIANPDIFVTGDLDFHTPEVTSMLLVLSPAAYLHHVRQTISE